MTARTRCAPTMVCPETDRIINPRRQLPDARVECSHCTQVHRLDEVVPR